jgi:hypothetical protein
MEQRELTAEQDAGAPVVGEGGAAVGERPTPAVGRRVGRPRRVLTAEQRAERTARRAQRFGYVALAVVVGITAAMSWRGLVGFGTNVLHLSRPWCYGVPVSLDMAAMMCGALSLQAVADRDSAGGPRLLTFALILGSASANAYNAQRVGGLAAALYFGSMSVLCGWLWDVVLRRVRRTVLRAIGAVERPLPRFRLVRWARYPRETYAAWSVAVKYGMTRPDEALAHVWQVAQVEQIEQVETLPEGIAKADAVHMALTATKGDVPAALEWLSKRGMDVDRSYAYDVRRKRVAALPSPNAAPTTAA